MSKARLVLVALVAQATAAQFPLSETCSNLPRCLGELPVRHPPGTDDVPTKSPPLVIGIIVDPTRRADPRDPNCPSGRCIIVDPTEICDGTQPNCLPFANIRQPSLLCKKKLPKCPSGGILLDPEISCHLLDTRCPPGGVYVSVPPGTNSLPNWIVPCTPGTAGCSKGQRVVDVPEWPPADDKSIPGVPFDPKKICSATTPGCRPGGIVVPWEPDDECDARLPGCLAITIPSKPIEGTGDPACPPPLGHICMIINPEACHPHQPNPPAGCMKVDPIPCLLGTPGCHSGRKLPDAVQDCVPSSNGCSDDGIRLPIPSKSHPDDPVVLPGDQALIVDPKGKLKCSFKSVHVVVPNPPATVTVLSPPATVTAACPSSKVSSQKSTPPTSTTIKKPAKPSSKPSIATDYAPPPSSISRTQPSISLPGTPEIIKRTITETVTHSTTPSPTSTSTSTPVPTPSAPAKPLSKFACSTSDTNPCLGAVNTPWTPFLLYHTPGSNPSPYNTQIHNPENHDLILTVTDDILKWEIFTVRLDGQILGDTSEHTPNWFANCGTNADDCLAKGWSHGYFKIPPGTHDLNIQWTRGGYWNGYSPGGTGIGNSGGQWRLSKSCTC